MSATIWFGLLIGVIASLVSTRGAPLAFMATIPAGLYVLVRSSVPTASRSRPLVAQTLSLVGVALTMTAVGLTGGPSSPYLLLAFAPAIEGAVVGGLRLGLSTAALSAGLLVVVTVARDPEGLSGAVALMVLFLAVPTLVAQVRRLLYDAEARASAIEEGARLHQDHIRRLETAHELLKKLSEVMQKDTISPTAIGEAGLEAVARVLPIAFGRVWIEGARGPIVAATRGNPESNGHVTELPLTVGNRRVGRVLIVTDRALTPESVSEVEGVIRPMGLAFANLLLLEDIARKAVEHERTRLARELHDEIGPSLAALGLYIDTTLSQRAGNRTAVSELAALRERVTGLVNDLRSVVADLRSPAAPSLRSHVYACAAELPAGPDVEVTLEERRPVRPSLAPDVHAIVGEAVRNAIKHSGANKVVVGGWVDSDRGWVTVSDDGSGFDPDAAHPGHFGLVGMRERAERAGLRLDITSSPSGTRLTLAWGEP